MLPKDFSAQLEKVQQGHVCGLIQEQIGQLIGPRNRTNKLQDWVLSEREMLEIEVSAELLHSMHFCHRAPPPPLPTPLIVY